MRFYLASLIALAAVASAQSSGVCNTNCITIPPGGIQVRAGGTYTLQWSNTSNGQVIIKLQTSTDITPSSGIILASGVDARTGSYVVTIPSNLPANGVFTFEIIDAANPNVYNFSNSFAIAGATGAVSSASSTGTSVSSSSRSGSSTATSGSSSSVTGQSSSSSTDSASRSSTMSSSRSSSASASAATTAAPNSNTNGASSLKIEGAALALIAAVAGLL